LLSDRSGQLIPALLADGYDLVFVNFLDGAGDVLENATAMRGFLNEVVNGIYRDNKTEEATLVGPSMGGLVTRIALTQMEQANPAEEHYVKTWVSFDSPHKGANISLSLQEAINYASQWSGVGGAFSGKLGAINSPCAKQLFLFHYTQDDGMSHPTPEHTALYSILDGLGFPKFSKNYGVTNGGVSVPYYTNGYKTINFKLAATFFSTIEGWANWNSPGTTTIFEGHGTNGEKVVKTETQLPLDNGQGSWISALYSINKSSFNTRADDNGDLDNIPLNKACFIPTASALGCDVTQNSVTANWGTYTNINDNSSGLVKTPFDEIYGMTTNEEHVRISPATRAYVMNQFEANMATTTRPIIRANTPINQEVKGKVAYTVTNTISFGNAGNGNAFSFIPGADVNVTAGKSVKLLKGFIAKSGSSVSIKIEPITNSTVLMGAVPKQAEVAQFDYTKPSVYLGKVYDYSEATNVRAIPSSVVLEVSPNPTGGAFNFTVSGLNGESVRVEVYNSLGALILSENISSNGIYHSDISAFESGMYMMKVKSETGEINKKIVKF
jgi:hypothetical protein